MTLIGWPLFAVPDEQGQLQYPSLEESVRQSVRVILSTRPGEQLMRPFFGAGLSQFLHEPNTLTTRRRIRDSVRDALARWEPRIVVKQIEVNEVPERPTWIRVEIGYQLRRTGAVHQAGFLMQLES